MLIIHKRKQVRLGGLTIPLSSSIALLLVCVVSITSVLCIYPCCLLSNGVHAEEGDGSSERNTEKNDIDALIHTDNIVNTDTSVTNNIPRATSPSTSLTINSGSNVNSSAITTAGSTAYISNDIRVQASDIESYALQISYANGSSSLNGNTAIGGAGGKTGSNLSDNTWGYGWVNSSNTAIPNIANTDMVYNTLPAYGSGVNLTGPSVSNNTVDFAGKLVFGAKFGEDASSGHYRTKVLLSLTATPKGIAVTGFGGIQKMQDMTANICSSVTTGTTGELYDTRDESIYTVAKLKDGKCWMTQNLRLALNRKLTPRDSNVSTPWPSSPLTSGVWTIEPNGPSGYEDGTTAEFGYNKYKQSYGFFYGWCALTAGNCPPKGTTAQSSICPKGWTIPSDSQYNSATSGITATSLVNSPFFFVEVGVLASDNAKTWEYRTSGKHYTTWTNTGGYWSSKVISGAPEVYPSDDYYEAYSVRCVTSGN